MTGARAEFEFSIDGELLYSKETGAYPEMKAIKQIVANAIGAQAEATART